MASRYSLDYKMLYLPDESYSYLINRRKYEDEQNYRATVGYNAVDALLTPLDIARIQDNANSMRKDIFDLVLAPCSILSGLSETTNQHINCELKTFADLGDDSEIEIVVL